MAMLHYAWHKLTWCTKSPARHSAERDATQRDTYITACTASFVLEDFRVSILIVYFSYTCDHTSSDHTSRDHLPSIFTL